MTITDSVTILPFIGPKQTSLLANLGIENVKDLLEHFPVYYKDSSKTVNLDQLTTDFKQTVKVVIDEIKNIKIRNGRFIQKAKVHDLSGSCEVTWFNQPFITKTLKPGLEVLMAGKLDPASKKPVMVSPEYEVVKVQNLHLGKIVPVYPLTKGLSMKWLRARFAYLIDHIDEVEELNSLPRLIEEKFELTSADRAFSMIHMPTSEDDIILARKRLAFVELLGIYLKLLKEKQQRTSAKAPAINVNNNQNIFKAKFPYQLTDSQLRSLNEINQDLAKAHPMYRLLQGDVGSGKTIVALLAAVPLLENGHQCVILAPTSVLAKQHYLSANSLFKDSFKIKLITSEEKKDEDANADLIIATHAILYHKQKYLHNLGLIIIDEQHRFGVEQRRALLELSTTGYKPHLLHMTATPIPRSVALTLFGEIDVSIIEKPEGRIAPVTRIVNDTKKEIAWNWIYEQVQQGGQVFWICPLIEETEEENNNTVKVIEQAETLQSLWPKLRIDFLHGKMKGLEKDKLLKRFQDHELDILVSTTVIEVGIDIAEANIIVIENAERYGLAQLHQLRGRVGRRNQKSWCLLFSPLLNNDKVKKRLEFFSQENQGIKIAEFDLQQRGPGEVYGTVQAGIPQLKIANFGNIKFLETVRTAAQEYLLTKDQ